MKEKKEKKPKAEGAAAGAANEAENANDPNNNANTDGNTDDNDHNDDLEDPETMLQFFEYENQRYRGNADSLEVVRANLLARIEGYEKDAQRLQKKVASLQKSVEIERRACDGMKKKCGLLEVEVPALREDIANYKTEALRSRGILAQNEIDLNNDRAKRLQILHENQILVDRNKFLEEEFKRKEEELRLSHQSQLKGLQSLDSVIVADKTLELLVKEQNSSMITMASELQNLQSQCRELTNTNHGFDVEVGGLNGTVRAQEDEIRRLRGIILMNQTKTVSLRNTASRNSASRNGTSSRGGARTTHSSSGQRGGNSNSNSNANSQFANSFGFADANASFGDVNKLLSDYTIDPRDQTGFGAKFTKAEKSSVYVGKTPGCDNTKRCRAKYVSNISNSKPAKAAHRTASDSDCDSSDLSGEEEEDGDQAEEPMPARTFGHPAAYVNPMQELEELTAFNQNVVESQRLGPTALSPVANPYLPVANKVIVNKNVKDKSRPSSTTLTAKRASTGSRAGSRGTAKYDYSTAISGLGLGLGLADTLNPALAKSMPNLPGIYSGAADFTIGQNRTQHQLPSTAGASTSQPGSLGPGGGKPKGLASVSSAPSMSSKKSAASSLTPASTSTARSLYVGQGLGMKHSQTSQYNLPSGSTRSMLQKILGDRDDLL